MAVYETSLEPRLYVEPRFVRMDLLTVSATHTYCPYKGTATYWTARVGGEVLEDIAWSYEDPLPEFAPLRQFPELRRGPRGGASQPARGEFELCTPTVVRGACPDSSVPPACPTPAERCLSEGDYDLPAVDVPGRSVPQTGFGDTATNPVFFASITQAQVLAGSWPKMVE